MGRGKDGEKKIGSDLDLEEVNNLDRENTKSIRRNIIYRIE